MFGWAMAPVLAAAIGLAGALASTLSLHHAAIGAIDRSLEERLRGAGESASVAFDGPLPNPERLRALMRANGLDAVYLVDPRFRIVADANGPSGRRADLLRLDVSRVRDGFAGHASVAPGYALGALTLLTGYFPVGDARAVLVLEAGEAFVEPHTRIARARLVGISLSVLSAIGLALVVGRWSRSERLRRDAAAGAARGEALSRVAAMAAHEIRNPLGVIRGTIDLMRERSGASLTERDRRSLDDITGEVERLRQLTQELVDLAADRPLALQPTSIADLLTETARAVEARFPLARVRCTLGPLPDIEADPARLRQVFANLLVNAAQAKPDVQIEVRTTRGDRNGNIDILVVDDGPGIPAEVGDRAFDLYFTTKSGGTGLGLAIARRFVEQHGGTLVYLGERRPGAAFQVTLPIRVRDMEGS